MRRRGNILDEKDIFCHFWVFKWDLTHLLENLWLPSIMIAVFKWSAVMVWMRIICGVRSWSGWESFAEFASWHAHAGQKLMERKKRTSPKVFQTRQTPHLVLAFLSFFVLEFNVQWWAFSFLDAYDGVPPNMFTLEPNHIITYIYLP